MVKIMLHVVRYYHIPSKAPIIKQLSAEFIARLTHPYLASLSFVDAKLTRRGLELIKSIQRKLNRAKLILSELHKSGKRKAAAYRAKTDAGMELFHNPLPEIIHKVIHLLNNLCSKKMIPNPQ